MATTKKTIAVKKTVTEKKATAENKVATASGKKVSRKVKPVSDADFISVQFQLKYHTEFGQNLFIVGNHILLGNGDIANAIPMQYLNEQAWTATVQLPKTVAEEKIIYNYVLVNGDGSTVVDWGTDKFLELQKIQAPTLHLLDTWNHAGYFENAFYTEPFQQVLLKQNETVVKTKPLKSATHIFKVKSPLLNKDEVICLTGSFKAANNWDADAVLCMGKEADSPYFELQLNLSKEQFPIAYKYGVYNTKTKKLIQFESGDNRILQAAPETKQLTVVQDGFVYLPNHTWKGAGVSIPVFSIRTHDSFGVGEFADLKKMIDWGESVGLKMIQLLPINDTTATHTNKDSYPYAAISAFALHPLYLNLKALAGKKFAAALKKLEATRQELNQLSTVAYADVLNHKIEFAKKVYNAVGAEVLAQDDFKNFFEENKDWLTPYAVFCYLRDKYGSVDFATWPTYAQYDEKQIAKLVKEGSKSHLEIAFHYFLQYQLHLQLKDATAYAHRKGIIIKGDIAIGVYRYGADTWQHPHLFHMDFQAGAPPDDFAVKGQNWGFPTYNWQSMQDSGFAWWKQRFEQMGRYFDAFRIDHILGFFRIWSIPMGAVEGIMGHFVPAIPLTLHSFAEKGIWFDYERYTKPYITDAVLWEIFGYDNELVKSLFLTDSKNGQYQLKETFDTQRKIESHFASLENDAQHQKIKQGLYSLISNIILFDANGDGQQFHFRFGIENTPSFKALEFGTQQQLKELYVHYFYKMQDDFWKKEAYQKLPSLKRVTNMLICGEDLGMVPGCVPEVMQQLGLLSLEIQRMPKNPERAFFHPNDAPYLSVVTPSTHDMSTIRGWWEEDRTSIQQFYNQELGQWGDAPAYCEAWINKAVVLQHLFSPAMWAVFQLQDLMGMHEQIRRENPLDEQINVPANPNHFWCYRMHLPVETLQETKAFNEELKSYIHQSGR